MLFWATPVALQSVGVYFWVSLWVFVYVTGSPVNTNYKKLIDLEIKWCSLWERLPNHASVCVCVCVEVLLCSSVCVRVCVWVMNVCAIVPSSAWSYQPCQRGGRLMWNVNSDWKYWIVSIDSHPCRTQIGLAGDSTQYSGRWREETYYCGFHTSLREFQLSEKYTATVERLQL